MLIILMIIAILFILGLVLEEDTKNLQDESTINLSSDSDTTSAFYDNERFGKNTILKQMIINERGAFCENCGGETELQVDHVIPISRGGTNEADNLQLLCYECHQKKHNYKFNEIGVNTQSVKGKYKLIRDAIDQEKKLEIKYQDYSGNTTERIISPIEIEKKDGKYYLKSYCNLRNEERVFRISRIKTISLTNENNK